MTKKEKNSSAKTAENKPKPFFEEKAKLIVKWYKKSRNLQLFTIELCEGILLANRYSYQNKRRFIDAVKKEIEEHNLRKLEGTPKKTEETYKQAEPGKILITIGQDMVKELAERLDLNNYIDYLGHYTIISSKYNRRNYQLFQEAIIEEIHKHKNLCGGPKK